MLAFDQTVYDSLKYIHVVASIVWVGSGLYFQFQGTRLRRVDDPSQLAVFSQQVAATGTTLLVPASLVVLAAGIALVLYTPALGFTDAWILIGLIGYAATFVTGAFFIGPTAGKIGATIQREGPEAPTVAPMIARLFTISRIDQVVLLFVIWAMVFKPGA